MAAAMFMNSNSLPVALMQSLVITIPALKWGPDDDNNAMVGRALTYLLLYSTIGMVLRWSVGWQLLTQSDSGRETNPEVDETSALVSPEPSPDDPVPQIQVQPTGRPRSYWFPNSHVHSASTSTVVASAEESDIESDSEVISLTPHAELTAPVLPRHVRQAQIISQDGAMPLLRRTCRRAYHAWVLLNGFMTAPLWAALASIVVACVAPLQHLFKDHMHPVKGALTNAGNCSIPTTLIVLGAYFYPPPPENASPLLDSGREKTTGRRLSEKKPAAYPGETKTVVIAIVSRMIVTPLLVLPLMALCAKFDWQIVFEECVFLVSDSPCNRLIRKTLALCSLWRSSSSCLRRRR
jgi:predicted permease